MAKIDELRGAMFNVMRQERQALRTYETLKEQANMLGNQLAVLEEIEAQKEALARAAAATAGPSPRAAAATPPESTDRESAPTMPQAHAGTTNGSGGHPEG